MNLNQISEQLGPNQTTVIGALNGYPEVSAAALHRVEAAAKEFNYRPSTRATGRALAIGHVIPMSTKHEMVNPVFGDFIAGAGETYARNGYEMILSIVDVSNEDQIYRSLKLRRAVDGVIVHGQVNHNTLPYTLLDVDNHNAFVQAADYLFDLGHQRIALITGLEERGLVMGKDISVISHDDMLFYLQNGEETPIFTATRSSVRTAGRQLAESLLHAIEHPNSPPQETILKCEFVVGHSTGPAPRKDEHGL